METVRTHVHPVALPSQIIHQFAGTVHQSWLRRTEVQKPVAGLQAQLLRRLQTFAKAQRTTETFHNQVVARDFTLRIARPQVDVRFPILVVEQLCISKPPSQLHGVEQLAQRYHGIAVRVVERIVEIDKQIGVTFHSDCKGSANRRNFQIYFAFSKENAYFCSMKVIVSNEIASVCPVFVGACVEAEVVNTPYCEPLWQEIHALSRHADH